MQFTYQLVGVVALCAPGLALLIGFYYGDASPEGRATQITTTPPAPTAIVSLGIIFLFSASVHLVTMTGLMMLDRFSDLAGRPFHTEFYERAGRLLAGSGIPVPEIAGLLAVLLCQVVVGLWLGRRVPGLILGDVLRLTAVYGWTRPYVEAARDPLRTVFATAILKTNARDARLMAYEGALDFLRLDGDLGIRSLVLRPAERLVLATDGRPKRDDVGEEAEVRETLEVFRESVQSVTLRGEEIHSVSFAVVDLGGLPEAAGAGIDGLSTVGDGEARHSGWLVATTVLLFGEVLLSGMAVVAAPAGVAGELMPVLQIPWRWLAGLATLLATLLMLGHVHRLQEERRSFRWLLLLALLMAELCGAVAASQPSRLGLQGLQMLLAVSSAAAATLAVVRLHHRSGVGVRQAVWLLAAIFGSTEVLGLQAVERLSIAIAPARGAALDALLLASAGWMLVAAVVGATSRWGGTLQVSAAVQLLLAAASTEALGAPTHALSISLLGLVGLGACAPRSRSAHVTRDD